MKRRRFAERGLRMLAASSVAAGLLFLFGFLGSVVLQGYGAFIQHRVELDLDFTGGEDAERRGPANPSRLARHSLEALFPGVTGRRPRRALHALLSDGAGFALREQTRAIADRARLRVRVSLPLSDDADRYFKGGILPDVPEAERVLSDAQIRWLDVLDGQGRISESFNGRFLASGDSREPELAGIRGALFGSLLTLGVTLALCLPLGVGAAIHLEEFAAKGRLSDFLEVNINNLAAVPSIVFGLLGLAVFLDVFGLPRSSPLVGGLVLALMALPTLVIASRSALAAVPPSLRDAARALGATRFQVVLHHVLPQAMPGILTGTVIGMARMLGETAPLLMIGMVAFIADVPTGFTDPSTVLPVQIYLWADSPERAFIEKTAGAILVLVALLAAVNGVAVWLRHHFEGRGRIAT